MARKFLYVIAVLIVLAIAGLFAYRLFGPELLRAALVPHERFRADAPVASAAYDGKAMWVARPDLPGNPALWTPPGYHPARGRAAVFFIHPTSYIEPGGHWNADAQAGGQTGFRTNLFVRSQASAFNEAGEIWAPRYRQASFGAFLTDKPDAQAALDLAYRDVLAAFDVFLRQAGPNRPIILAGHSQGALHLMRLLQDRVAGTSLARRVVAAYVVGWPISTTADLPRLGLPACTAAAETGCVLSWASFAEPADPALILDVYDKSTGLTGAPRRGTPMVCTNPLTGGAAAAAPASANLGTLVPSSDLMTATVPTGAVPARCAGRGFLLIGEPPNVGSYVLPGNNYHVYDYALFWANVRADATRRLATFEAASTGTALRDAAAMLDER
ncbi:DUF3089 domain-containing protein [Sphingomonas sp.]|uniref:DUF3089 domain-containing protein n=1 Tax=Sphingomonas sp. TaxID=28214 RepID=UPI003CC58F0A